MIGWSRKRLALSAQVAERTLVDFETGARRPLNRTINDIKRAIEDAGIVFIDAEEDGDGPGVRLRRGLEGQ